MNDQRRDAEHTAVRAAAKRLTHDMGELVHPCVVPVMAPDAKGNPRPVGSAVLFASGNRTFVLTAAHVVTKFQTHGMYLGGRERIVEAEGRRHYSVPTAPGGVDRADVGFIELSQDEAASLGEVRFLRAADVDPDEWSRPLPQGRNRALYVVFGYPASKMKRNPVRLTVRTPPMTYLGPGASPDKYAAVGVEPHSHLVVDFVRDALVTRTGVGRGPVPRGVSGGGAWRCENLTTGDLTESRLVAIMTEWHQERDLLVGTRVGPILEEIRTQYPE